MEIVLDVYQRPYDSKRPVICLDEKPGQLLKEVNEPLPLKAGQPRRYDYEYRRAGTYNVFVAVEPLAGWRYLEVRPTRTSVDFAQVLAALADRYREAETLTIVLDNLNTHRFSSLWKAFGPERALQLARRIQFVFTPVHGSWLNMAEIELAAMQTECLGRRRLGNLETVSRETQLWAKQRNRRGVTIDWGFTVDDSRTKFHRHYANEFDQSA